MNYYKRSWVWLIGGFVLIIVAFRFFQSDFFVKQAIRNNQETVSTYFVKNGKIIIKSSLLNDSIENILLMPLEVSEINITKLDSLFQSDTVHYNLHNTFIFVCDTVQYASIPSMYQPKTILLGEEFLKFLINEKLEDIIRCSVEKEQNTFYLKMNI
jgi:hypothetical protein